MTDRRGGGPPGAAIVAPTTSSLLSQPTSDRGPLSAKGDSADVAFTAPSSDVRTQSIYSMFGRFVNQSPPCCICFEAIADTEPDPEAESGPPGPADTGLLFAPLLLATITPAACRLLCDHQFHAACIGSWFIHQARPHDGAGLSCPICREPVVSGFLRRSSRAPWSRHPLSGELFLEPAMDPRDPPQASATAGQPTGSLFRASLSGTGMFPETPSARQTSLQGAVQPVQPAQLAIESDDDIDIDIDIGIGHGGGADSSPPVRVLRSSTRSALRPTPATRSSRRRAETVLTAAQLLDAHFSSNSDDYFPSSPSSGFGSSSGFSSSSDFSDSSDSDSDSDVAPPSSGRAGSQPVWPSEPATGAPPSPAPVPPPPRPATARSTPPLPARVSSPPPSSPIRTPPLPPEPDASPSRPAIRRPPAELSFLPPPSSHLSDSLPFHRTPPPLPGVRNQRDAQRAQRILQRVQLGEPPTRTARATPRSGQTTTRSSGPRAGHVAGTVTYQPALAGRANPRQMSSMSGPMPRVRNLPPAAGVTGARGRAPDGRNAPIVFRRPGNATRQAPQSMP
ncbi:hypothetical protein H696_01147 [Fonticula alba]|uniref:RING-type domain-containing protein n=1 Tax=Fonticula alba TaxID=691883 RepID=A0A058ZCR2_FONAL|nr:hypothetical protein H696_01147 [Fonticula alba]KCV71726.1 hypothetical protein H696_01147 [Fonticula alba]|eukprot:XP_009493304.1 hypothetical protein H696_01147 [Fonticula alba]